MGKYKNRIVLDLERGGLPSNAYEVIEEQLKDIYEERWNEYIDMATRRLSNAYEELIERYYTNSPIHSGNSKWTTHYSPRGNLYKSYREVSEKNRSTVSYKGGIIIEADKMDRYPKDDQGRGQEISAEQVLFGYIVHGKQTWHGGDWHGGRGESDTPIFLGIWSEYQKLLRDLQRDAKLRPITIKLR